MSRLVAVSAVVVLIATLIAPSPTLAQAAPFCAPGQGPRFMFGIGTLKDRLGQVMGDPIECEHVNPDNGHTIQRTTTGLAYYVPQLNLPIFTNGQAHWALSSGGVILWRNNSVTPPQPTPAESAYLSATGPIHGQVNALLARLDVYRQWADQGQLNAADVADLATVYDDLVAARDAFARAGESERLAPYDAVIVSSIDAAVASAETLLRARLTTIPAARAAFLAESAARAAESRRLVQEANETYSWALPIVVG